MRFGKGDNMGLKFTVKLELFRRPYSEDKAANVA